MKPQRFPGYSCSRRLPAHGLILFYLNFESQNQAKNIPVVLPSSPIKTNLRQIGQGVHELWSDIQIDKQRLQLYIYSWFLLIFSFKISSLYFLKYHLITLTPNPNKIINWQKKLYACTTLTTKIFWSHFHF